MLVFGNCFLFVFNKESAADETFKDEKTNSTKTLTNIRCK